MSGGRPGEPGDRDTVVVPTAPGPLLWPGHLDARGRDRDDLDELIDVLLPDSSEGPGVTDAALVGGGVALLGWSALGSPPVAATVAGAVALGLGCILPLRAAWRRLADRRRARTRAALLARGVPMSTTDPALARLVAAYEELDGPDTVPQAARAAAHAALLEVATLLGGRTPSSDKERASWRRGPGRWRSSWARWRRWAPSARRTGRTRRRSGPIPTSWSRPARSSTPSVAGAR